MADRDFRQYLNPSLPPGLSRPDAFPAISTLPLAVLVMKCKKKVTIKIEVFHAFNPTPEWLHLNALPFFYLAPEKPHRIMF